MAALTACGCARCRGLVCFVVGRTRCMYRRCRSRLTKCRSLCMRKLILETTAPFQGLPELVACDEGLFAREGIEIEWADVDEGLSRAARTDISSPKPLDPFLSHGRLF